VEVATYEKNLPPYRAAVTSALIADKVSRAVIFLPIAAWIGTSNNWRGITLSTVDDDDDDDDDVQLRCTQKPDKQVLTEFLDPSSTNSLCSRSMYNQREGIDGLGVEKKHHLYRRCLTKRPGLTIAAHLG